MKNEYVNQHPHTLGLNLFTLCKYILGSKTNKYLPLIVKELQNRSDKMFKTDDGLQEDWSDLLQTLGLENSVLNFIPEKNRYIAYHMLQSSFLSEIKTILSFENLYSSNYINNVDISTLNTFKELENHIHYGTTRKILNQERKLVETVFETDEWLAIRPLTYESSKKYGAGTKWCTSSEKYPLHFYQYNREGILVYLFNKTNHNKFGLHFSNDNNESPLSIYDSSDIRIDSSIAGIPLQVMQSIFKGINYNKDSPLETSQDYIKRVYPQIWEEYWVPHYNDKGNESYIEDLEFEGMENQHNEHIETYPEFYEDNRPTFSPNDNLIDTNVYDETYSNMLNIFVDRMKPKTIFHKWYNKIYFGGHKKIVLLGVPVNSYGIQALQKTQDHFEKSLDTTHTQLVFYPVYNGNDLVITKI